MKTSENVNEIGKAMACVQGEMKPAIKDSNNPFFKSKYSNLTSVWDSIREPLMRNQISVFQDVVTTENGVSVTTKLIHSSGQWIDFGPLEIPLSKRDAQAIGSATSYAKRYSLSAACGVVTDDQDDDGEAAMDRNQQQNQKKEIKPKPKEEPKEEIKFISNEQLTNITQLTPLCEPSYRTKLVEYLAKDGIDDFEKLPAKSYDKVFKGLSANAEIYQKKIAGEKND